MKKKNISYLILLSSIKRMSQMYMATCSFCGFRQDVQNPIFYCCRCKAYCNETGKLSQTYDQLVSENNYLKNNNQFIVDKYNALLNQFNMLNSQYISGLADIDAMKKELTRKSNEFTQVTNESNKLKEDIKNITLEKSELSKKFDELKSECAKKYAAQQQKFDKLTSELSKKYSIQQHKFDELKSKLSKKSIDYNDINGKLQELKTQHSKKQEELANQRKINKDLEIKVASLTNSLAQSKKYNEEMSKISKKHRKEINKLNESHRKALERSEEHHLNVLAVMGEGDKLTIQKLEEENKKLNKCNDTLHKTNNEFLETIAVYATTMEGYLQRHVIDIDVYKNTLEKPFFSRIKQQTLLSMLGMVDVHHRRLISAVNQSSVLVNEVKVSVFLRHFHQCLKMVFGKTKDKDIIHCLLPYNTPYKLKRLFILSRYSFNTFIEILTTHIPQEKLSKTRNLIMSSLITTKEDADLMLHILNVKRSNSGKYFRYSREFINNLKNNDARDILQFEADVQCRFTEDYIINTLSVNITPVWAAIVQKYAKDLPKIEHDIVPIVKCEEILKGKINSSK